MQDVATQVLICAMAVPLLQMQSQPEAWSQAEPSHEPMQSLQEHEGSQPCAATVATRVAIVNDFMLAVSVKIGNEQGSYELLEGIEKSLVK